MYESYKKTITPSNITIWEKDYSLQEFLDLKNQEPECQANKLRHGYLKNYPEGSAQRDSWFGGLTKHGQAVDLFIKGWPEGAERLQKLANEITDLPMPVNRLRRRIVSDQGDEYRLDQVLNYEFDQAYIDRKRKMGLGPAVVDLLVNFGGNCNRTAEELFYQGAAAVISADLLEQAGYQVGIIATPLGEFGIYDSQIWMPKIYIKEPSDPFQISNLAAIIAHAGVFRTIGFLLLNHSPGNCGEGLGHQIGFSNLFRYQWPKPDNTYIVDSALTKQAVIETVVDLITQIQSNQNEII